MKKIFLLVGMVLLFGVNLQGDETSPAVKATFYNTEGEEIGNAVLEEGKEGVSISLLVRDLSPGFHGFHIHAVGKCEPPDFTSAGAHFNPHGKEHGLKNPKGAHAGDLDNLFVGNDGTARGEWLVKGVTLGSGDHSLFHPDGTALVIHANPDDEVTDPIGNAGTRIACGVIER